MKIIYLLGAAFSIYMFYALFAIHDQLLTWWNLLNIFLLILTLICAWGLWKKKSWALVLSFLLALGALGLGGYLVHFVWTFWIFEKPSLLDRVLSTLHPRVSVFVLFPILWFLFFNRKSVKGKFLK